MTLSPPYDYCHYYHYFIFIYICFYSLLVTFYSPFFYFFIFTLKVYIFFLFFTFYAPHITLFLQVYSLYIFSCISFILPFFPYHSLYRILLLHLSIYSSLIYLSVSGRFIRNTRNDGNPTPSGVRFFRKGHQRLQNFPGSTLFFTDS